MKLKKNIILSIETAIAGGSLALSIDDAETDSWKGTGGISKAEEILDVISELLKKNKLGKEQLGLIMTGSGPGSTTGTKIGLAIAKGLCNALEVELVEVSTFEMLLAAAVPDIQGKIITVLPAGRNLIFRNIYDNEQAQWIKDLPDIQAINIEEFTRELKTIEYGQIIFHPQAFANCSSDVDAEVEIEESKTIIVKNLASMMLRK